jgi:transposase
VKAQAAGRLGETSAKPFNAEQVEIARLKAELARVKMERDILKKAAAYFAKESL